MLLYEYMLYEYHHQGRRAVAERIHDNNDKLYSLKYC